MAKVLIFFGTVGAHVEEITTTVKTNVTIFAYLDRNNEINVISVWKIR